MLDIFLYHTNRRSVLKGQFGSVVGAAHVRFVRSDHEVMLIRLHVHAQKCRIKVITQELKPQLFMFR